MISALDDAQRNIRTLGIKTKLLPKKRALERLKERIEKSTKKGFETWAKGVKAKTHSIKPHHGKIVARDYFVGNAPFAQRKSRKDIPDSFIYQCIIDISKQCPKLHVVADDGALSEACQRNSRLAVHRSLDDFIKTPECIALIKNQEFSHDLPRVTSFLKTQHLVTLSDQLSYVLDTSLPGNNFEDRGIPSDGNEASIDGVYETTEVEFDFESIDYLGFGSILLPFLCTVDADVGFFIFKGDYYVLSDDRQESISVSEYNNDHYFEAQERHEVSVSGVLGITFDLDSLEPGELVSDNLDVMLDEASITLNDIHEIRIKQPPDYIE
ncbi:hypothetical protein YTPLAS18_17020 [Nitrospira sp.]|nr:hypothetical protein YTPLAS18_17020 [Nitrospira sp.]